jgi:hypothetical protein
MLHTMLAGIYAMVGLTCFTAGVLYLPGRVSGSWRLRRATGSLIVVFECEIAAITAYWIISI